MPDISLVVLFSGDVRPGPHSRVRGDFSARGFLFMDANAPTIMPESVG
jgi:hypothetical protein